MVLGGLALALSRLIDNSVVVLENIFRHLEDGESPVVAAETGGKEVALPVLAGTLTTVVVFQRVQHDSLPRQAQDSQGPLSMTPRRAAFGLDCALSCKGKCAFVCDTSNG